MGTDDLRRDRHVVKGACPHDCPDTCALEITVEGGRAVEIAGSKTKLVNPDSLAIDKAHYIYTADDGGSHVAVFAPTAHGNVAPARIVGGSKSNLGPTEGILIDPLSDLWVSSYGNNDVTEYAPNANGNVAPILISDSETPGVSARTGVAAMAASTAMDTTNVFNDMNSP